MRRLVGVMATVVVAAVLLAGCSSDARDTSHKSGSPSGARAAGSVSPTHRAIPSTVLSSDDSSAAGANGSVFVPPAAATPIRGKINNGYLFFGAGGAGIAGIDGFFGAASTASGQLVTTMDAGARWTLRAATDGIHALDGFRFVSATQGWVWTSQPGLFFTVDAARSWHPVATHFFVQASASTAGVTWFAGATCAALSDASCITKLYASDHVGTAPVPLAHQPSLGGENVDSLAAPSPEHLIALISNGAPAAQLERSTDGGTWSTATLPPRCAHRSSSRSLTATAGGGLVLVCAAPGQNMNPTGPVTIFTSSNDANSWHALSPIGAGTVPTCCVNTVVAPTPDVLWATVQPPAGDQAVFRSSDDGRSWTEVLNEATAQTTASPGIIAFTATSADNAWVLLKAYKSDGAVFWIARTTDGGQTWHTSVPGFTGKTKARPKPR